MAKRIERNQVIADGIFDDFIKGAQKTLETGDKVKQKLTEMLSVSKEFFMTWRSFDAKGIRDFNKAMNDSASVLRQLEQLKKDQARTQEALNKALAANEKLQREAIKTEEQRAKSTKRQAEEQRKLNSVYEQNKKRLNEVSKALMELESRGRGSSKVARGLRDEFNKLNHEVRNAEESVGRFQRNVGNYPKVAKNIGSGVLALAGVSIGLASVGNAARASIDAFTEFDAKLKEVSAITGLSGEQLEFFANKAKETGTTTRTSATDYLEAIKLIGSASPILLKNSDALAAVTDDAITLSEAAGIDLPTAAAALTSSLNQFNLSADQSDRVINALAAGSKEGSAEVNDLNESFKNVGTVAADANISFEQTVALLETLAERQLKGAEAGTKLRGAISQLQKAGVGFASGKFNINDALKEASERLNAIQDPAKKAQAQIKLFGIENQVAGSILLQNQKKFQDLTKAVTGTNTALDQARINNSSARAEGERLDAQIKTLSIELGETLLPILNAVKSAFVDLIDALVNGSKNFMESGDHLYASSLRWAQGLEQISKSAKKTADVLSVDLEKGIGKAISLIDASKKMSGAFLALEGATEETRKEGEKLIQMWEKGTLTGEEFLQQAIKLYALEGRRKRGLTEISKALQDAAKSTEDLNKIQEEGGAAGMSDKDLQKAISNFRKLYQEQVQSMERDKELELLAIERTGETEEKKKLLREQAEQDYLFLRIRIDQAYSDQAANLDKDLQDEIVGNRIKSEQAYAKIRSDQDARELEEKRKTSEKLAEIQRLVNEQEIKNTEDKFERERLLALNDFKQRVAQLEKEDKLTQELEVAMKKELSKKLAAIDEDQNEANFEDDLKNYQEYYKFRELELLKSGKSESEIEAQLHKDRIEFLKDEIALRQEYGKETIDLEIELANMQRQNQQKRLEDIKEFSTRAIEIAEQEIQRQNELRSQVTDKEIEKRESAIERQRELAEKGIDNTLVYEEQKLAQAELEKARLAKKELRDQQKITFLKLLQGYATEGKASEAVRRALTDIALAQVIQGSFYEGTEHIGDSMGAPVLPGRDGYIIRADKDEAILTGKQNKKRGDLSNDELVDVGHKFLSGDLVPRGLTPAITIPGRSAELLASSALMGEIKQLNANVNRVEKAIKDRPVTERGYDPLGNFIETIHKNGLTTKTTYKKYSRPRI